MVSALPCSSPRPMQSIRSQAAELTWAVPNHPNMASAKPGRRKRIFESNLIFEKKEEVEEKMETEPEDINVVIFLGKKSQICSSSLKLFLVSDNLLFLITYFEHFSTALPGGWGIQQGPGNACPEPPSTVTPDLAASPL